MTNGADTLLGLGHMHSTQMVRMRPGTTRQQATMIRTIVREGLSVGCLLEEDELSLKKEPAKRSYSNPTACVATASAAATTQNAAKYDVLADKE